MSNPNLKAPYGIFPYIIYKNNSFIMMSIPVHFNKEKNSEIYPGIHCTATNKPHSHFDPLLDKDVIDDLIEKMRVVRKDLSKDKKSKARICLVLSPNQCIYFEENHELKSDKIPVATTLVNPRGKVLGIGKSNYQVPVVYEAY